MNKLVTEKLNEAYNNGDHDADERDCTEEELLQGLDLIEEAPPNFLNHQWENYKSYLRTSKAKVLCSIFRFLINLAIHGRC